MNIVYIAPCSPWPAVSGGSMRSLALWESLKAVGSVRLVVLGDKPIREVRSRLRAENAWIYPSRLETPASRMFRCVSAALRGKSIPAGRYLSVRREQRLLARLHSEKPDLIVLGDAFMTDLVPGLRRLGCPLIIDSQNAESRLYARISRLCRNPIRRLAYTLLTMNIRQVERRNFRLADQLWVVSGEDREYYLRWLRLSDIHVVPNVVLSNPSDLPEKFEPGALVFTGIYAYPPNEDAALRLIALSGDLKKRGVSHKLYLVGRGPTARMSQEADANPQIVITGEVPSVRPFLDRAALFVAPLFAGSGTKFKILEAMAAGCAVLTTSCGAEGLGVAPGTHLVVEDDIQRYSGKIQTLLRDPDLCRKLGSAARLHIENNFSLEVMKQRVSRCLAKLVPA